LTEPADFLQLSVSTFLDRVQDRSPAPGGGAVAALVAAMASSLCAMAGRFSEPPDADPSPVARRAIALADAAAPLAQADAAAYGRFLEARRLPREPDPEPRQQAIAEATSTAAEVPLQVARIAAETAELGATIAAEGNPNLRGDAVTAALLGAAAARAAATLVAINLEGTADSRVEESAALATTAEEAARGAVTAIR
jgi:formiminotetrahydrofolate cyclodeaminase